MNNGIIDNYDVIFDFGGFLKFLDNNNIFSVTIASILSDRLNEFTSVFVTNLILPLFSMDLNNDGESDIQTLNEKTIKYKGAEFKIGEVITSILRLIIITLMLYAISILFKDHVKKL